MNIAERTAEESLRKWQDKNGPAAPYEGPKVLVFSLETSGVILADRMMQCRAGVSTLHPQQLTQTDCAKLAQAAGEVAQLPLLIEDDSSLNISQIQAMAQMHKANGGLSLVIIDYLQIIAAERSPNLRAEDRQAQVAAMSMGIKALAKDCDCPVIAICQLNREIEKSDRPPRLSDLRESGQIEQDADLVMMLWDSTPSDEDRKKNPVRSVEVRVAKNKDGPAGFDVPLTFRAHIYRYENRAKIKERDYPTYDPE